MKISIFGMGYVGAASAACLIDDGHIVTGVDIDLSKVKNLSEGKTPMIYESGIQELLYKGHVEGRLKATNIPFDAVCDADMIWVCVGTPPKFDWSKDIGNALRKTDNRPLIVIRSTCLPGTMKDNIKPLLEKTSGLVVGKDIDLVFHPEFLREGTAIYDFKNPSKIVIGEYCCQSVDLILEVYKNYNVPCFRLNYSEAEMVKYCDNIFHALKITFANEMGMIANSVGIDSRKIADVYCSDSKLNISSAYLYPGFAYGGSCLSKDLKAMTRFASLKYLHLPMINGIVESNKNQINNLIYRILSYNPSSVGMVGISFKKGTDDMRGSPYVEVAKSLIGEGVKLKIYDPIVRQECLIGSNKEEFDNKFRNIEGLLVSSIDEMTSVDLVVINHSIVDVKQVEEWVRKKIHIIDLINIQNVDKFLKGYEGIYW